MAKKGMFVLLARFSRNAVSARECPYASELVTVQTSYTRSLKPKSGSALIEFCLQNCAPKNAELEVANKRYNTEDPQQS